MLLYKCGLQRRLTIFGDPIVPGRQPSPQDSFYYAYCAIGVGAQNIASRRDPWQSEPGTFDGPSLVNLPRQAHMRVIHYGLSPRFRMCILCSTQRLCTYNCACRCASYELALG